jgi:hypothetical protein
VEEVGVLKAQLVREQAELPRNSSGVNSLPKRNSVTKLRLRFVSVGDFGTVYVGGNLG